MSFNFDGADILYSNLGGSGPLAPSGASAGSQAIRYVNVGAMYLADGSSQFIDLLVTNRTRYTPFDASQNVLNGLFANINLACNEAVTLRVTTMLSCAAGPSCRLCDQQSGSSAIDSCYAAGCACYGTSVTAAAGGCGVRFDEVQVQHTILSVSPSVPRCFDV